MDDAATRLLGRPLLGSWFAEAGFVVVMALAVELQIAVATEPGARPAGPVAYAFGALIAMVLLARRRWPLQVLCTSVALVFLYHLLGNPGISPVLSWSVPLYYTARAGRVWWAAAAAASSVSLTLLFSVLQDHEPVTVTLDRLILDAALLAALILLGEAIRSRQALAAEMRGAEERATLERVQEAERRVTEERLHIARELHDVLAHTLTGAAVQAGVAADTLDDDPETSRAALNVVRASYQQARAELATTVSVLRTDRSGAGPAGQGRSPSPRLAHLEALLTTARQTGLQVELHIDGQPRRLPAALDLTAYRIVQESLTNVIQHAQARSVLVRLAYEQQKVTVSVTDDGRGAVNGCADSPQGEPGHGLIGMRERASALGGQILFEPPSSGGFRVAVTLPDVAGAGVPR